MDIDGPPARLRAVNVERPGSGPHGADAETTPLPAIRARRGAPDPAAGPAARVAEATSGTMAAEAATGEAAASGEAASGEVASGAAAPEVEAASPRGRNTAPPRRRRRVGVLLLAVGVLVAALAGGAYLVFSSLFSAPDFEGTGEGAVIVQVADGDSTAQIGRTLAGAGVVASVEAFLDAAQDDERIRSVQPGSYQMRSRMSAASAVQLLLDPAARVGQLEIRGGVQLDDTSAPDGTVAPGVLTLISRATCTTIDGADSCLSVDELRVAMADTDPEELGVPEWALDGVAAADPVRRLEGLLAPGLYDVTPGATAEEVLRGLLATSTDRLTAAGLVSGAAETGFSPYEVLIIASLVEKEGITADMPKVARVVYNRLGTGQRLELDSTVNYPLDLQALRTTAADRDRSGPYNSYAVAGLPPTPIAAAGREAIAAALDPEPGPWFYFVRCQPDGTSCFAETFAEHGANVELARENGAF